MKDVQNDARQILIGILKALKDCSNETGGILECRLLNVVFRALGAPPDGLRWNREFLWDRWAKSGDDEASIEQFLDWASKELEPQLN